MKVAVLTNNFPPCLDGVGDYSYHLASEFQRNGHKVSVLCRQDRAIQKAVANGQFNILVSPTIPAWNWLAIRPLRRFIREQRPDWLLVQYVPNGFQQWAIPIWLPVLLWLVKREGVKVSITFHEVYVRMTYWPLRYWLVGILQRVVCIALARVADSLITSIDLYACMLRKYTRKEVNVIPIGSNILPVPVTTDERLAIRNQIAPVGQAIISTFGLRNQDLLLTVFDELIKLKPDTCLLICSKLNISADSQVLYKRLKAHITVTGFIDAPDVYLYLQSSDVFFIPDVVNKRGEGGTSNKSTSLASALVAGLPVVGIVGDMNNDLLSLIPHLFLADIAEPKSIAQKMLTMINDVDKCSQRKSIKQFSDEHLSWRAIYKQYMLCTV
ncbi:glycosyltransferase family 4 protein [Spirosoma rigui]|uniref:glycosyltransferase family 4 protein n=1 Tax=Spirosoma rigui TaxID=564064 RepID=UPI0009AFBFBB|nr:glycosyltransferase family 4 protein [Spirosoma rigui]